MTHSHGSWKRSANCRLEWRPSLLVAVIICGLGFLSVVGLAGTALTGWGATGLSVLVMSYSLWIARRYLGQPARLLVIPGGELPPMLDGAALHRFKVQWRGPLAFVAWQDGQGGRGYLAWWPDTLDARQRRELRLAAGDIPVSAEAAAVAP